MGISCFFVGSIFEKLEQFLRNSHFTGGYGQIGKILCGRIRPDWGSIGLSNQTNVSVNLRSGESPWRPSCGPPPAHV